MINFNSSNFKGTIIAEYKQEQDALKATESSQRFQVEGRRIKIDYLRKQKARIGDCWFCYDNPNIERHLVLEEGKGMYAALPKGAINDYHIMLIPKNHEESYDKLEA